MTITPTTLTRLTAVAAIAAGAVFIGVQLNHPELTVAGVNSTEWVVRSSLKVLMAALALVGITGIYLHQVRKMGLLGLVGYVLFAANYLVIGSVSFVAAYVLPSIDATSTGYVRDALAVASGGHATGDIGALETVIPVEAALYLAGGLLFGVALFRSGILPRWASALLAVGGAVSAAQQVLPDPWFRLLAFPNGFAMIALGYALWRITGTRAAEATETSAPPATLSTPRVIPAGVA
ncbi:MAG: hypothetical protein JWR20_2721 [Marmoricola sp.]|nr:hypothetical protein [Marmoricola sp.]